MIYSKESLIQKYNVPAPRYTSYPPVPCWDLQVPKAADWLKIVNKTFNESNTEKGISLYIHLPFCESLCTYCGCNTRITKNHGVELTYIDAVLKEWKTYLSSFTAKPIIRELHLGGGTPTFFSPQNLNYLITSLLKEAEIHPLHEFSFEGHPNNTTGEHLQELYNLGFRRVSFGIQDFDEKVQKTINRIQSFSNVEKVTQLARNIGYSSVNFDLIYGLPYQTLLSVDDTINKVTKLMPDRIAFYSYAHVPWIKPGQRSYTKKDLPADAEKRALYELGLEKFKALGYTDIGMDHFALPGDSLYQAMQNKTLHRNFMGYTTCQTDLLIGLGTSSISDAKYAYLQNEKKVEDYKSKLSTEELPVLKGHFLTEEDLLIKDFILDIICKSEVQLNSQHSSLFNFETENELKQMEQEGLISLDKRSLQVTEIGKAFIRNICMVFDLRHKEMQFLREQVFSKAI